MQNSYRKNLTLPCGGIKYGEQPTAAAVRELEEEVGLRASIDDLVALGRFDFRHDYMRDDVYAYELRFTESPPVAVDNREVIEYQFATLEDALTKDLSEVARALLSRYN